MVSKSVNSKSRNKGFTLIELLVVIAVIALLMSILLPSMDKVKRRTKALVCRANLRQWSYVFKMYTDEHDNKFMSGHEYESIMTGPSGYSGEGSIDDSPDHSWPLILRSYYKDEKLLCCPTANRSPITEHGERERRDTVSSGWGLWVYYPTESIYGSYGINSWLLNRDDEAKRWKTIVARKADRIPMLLDCFWCEGYPEHSDEPPISRRFGRFGDSENHMKRFCVDRHDENTNGLFMDLSARSVGIKELWELEWHRDWNKWNAPPPVWPEWMRGFKEYWTP